MHAFNVNDLFQIRGRGVVVETDRTYETLPNALALKVGDPIEFRHMGRTVLRTYVAGIEICCPWSPKQPFVFLLPPTITTQTIPVGTEIWVSPASIRPAKPALNDSDAPPAP